MTTHNQQHRKTRTPPEIRKAVTNGLQRLDPSVETCKLKTYAETGRTAVIATDIPPHVITELDRAGYEPVSVHTYDGELMKMPLKEKDR